MAHHTDPSPPSIRRQHVLRSEPYLDDAGKWRVRVTTQRTKFDDEQKHIFLEEYRKDAILGRAAMAAGVSIGTVKKHMKEDPDFAEACMDAQGEYQAKLLTHHQDLVFNGVQKRTFDRNGNVVSEETQYPIRLIELELKAKDPQYRDKREVDVNVSGGVLVAPASMGSIEDWESKYGDKAKSDETAGQSRVIEGEVIKDDK